MWLIFWMLASASALFATSKDPYVTAVTEGEPSANVFNCVNAITGDFFLMQQDIVIRGAEPIALRRCYISGDGEGEDGGWFFQPHQEIFYYKSDKLIEVVEPSGTVLFYKGGSKKKARRAKGNIPFTLDEKTMGLTNCGNGRLSGRTHPKNISVEMELDEKIIRVYGANGTERCYKLVPDQKHTRKKGACYHLIWESLPNGNIIRYGYDDKHRLNKINSNNSTLTTEYAHATVHYIDRLSFDVKTSDGRTLSYRHNEDGLLALVESPDHPTQVFTYLNPQKSSGPLIGFCQDLKNIRGLSIAYYRLDKPFDAYGHHVVIKNKSYMHCNSVRTLHAGRSLLYTFFYEPAEKYTEVYDAHGNRTIYRYTEDYKLETIERFSGYSALINRERFVWEGANLILRTFYDEMGGTLLERRFAYDQWNNVKEETFNNYTKRYTYDEEDLLVSETEDNGRSTRYRYLSGTDLVTAQLLLQHNKICKRTFYEYNQDHLLVREIIDDGDAEEQSNLNNVTQRLIQEIELKKAAPFIGMPEILTEKALNLSTHQEELIGRTKLVYSGQGQIIQKQCFDAQDKLRYTLHYTYDARGRLIEETNPLGQTAHYTYDQWDNRVTTQDFSEQTTKQITYDTFNRPIATEQNGRVTQHEYDILGRLIRTIDWRGTVTTNTYDALGRLLSTESPHGTEFYTYNAAGQRIRTVNAKGEVTTTRFNHYGKPLEIYYSDGTAEHYIYNPDGTLLEAIDPAGTHTRYTYDVFGNVTKKALYTSKDELLAKETFHYNAFHLLSETDREEQTTYYTYDAAGRKIADTTTHYTYDALGRLQSKQQGEILETYEYDLLGRPVKETKDGLTITTTYDAYGNKASISRTIDGVQATEYFAYDAFNRPTTQVDALGQISRVEYHDAHNQKIYTDPRGVQTIETYDAFDRKIHSTIKSPLGDILAEDSYTYDALDNLIRQESDSVITLWEYGPRSRPVKLTEAAGTPEQKITRTHYTSRGQVATIIKPSGTTLDHTYDGLGNLTSLTSSDGTIHYSYTYDRCSRLLTSRDQLTDKITARTYDTLGRLTQEILSTGHILKTTYDTSGRKSSFILPDNSSIAYTYNGSLLHTVSRQSPDSQTLYTHTYASYDNSGNPLTETLIHNLGTRYTRYDTLNRPLSTHAPAFKQTIAYDPAGNITTQNINSEEINYTYDDFSQLLTEKGHTYTYDRHYNRTSKDGDPYTLNATHQLLSSYTYDPDGNPTSKNSTHFTYDALGRLTEAVTDNRRILYTYDSYHRCVTRTTLNLNNTIVNREDILYDGQNDIGTASPLGYIANLRILGRTPRAEIGSAIAFEIEGKTYAPIYDIQGNVRALISTQQSEAYTYTAFGEGTPGHIRNPWRYASKRHDPDTNLYNFGRRFYDPETGRFLTPDPKGYTDSLNLYAYVLNDPLTNVDLYGLEMEGLVGAAINLVGDLLYNVVYHAIPNNPIRILLLMALGMITSKSIAVDPIACCPHETVGEPGDGNVVMANGMLTDHDEVRKRAGGIVNNYKVEVRSGHNNSQGTMTDLLEALKGLLGFQTETSKNAYLALKASLAAAGPEGNIIAIGHSQGGIDLKNALKLLTPEERKRIDVRTFGSPSTFDNMGFRSLKHTASSSDPVAWIFNPIQYLKAVFSPDNSRMQVVQSQGGMWDHSFEGTTYNYYANLELKNLIKRQNVEK